MLSRTAKAKFKKETRSFTTKKWDDAKVKKDFLDYFERYENDLKVIICESPQEAAYKVNKILELHEVKGDAYLAEIDIDRYWKVIYDSVEKLEGPVKIQKYWNAFGNVNEWTSNLYDLILRCFYRLEKPDFGGGVSAFDGLVGLGIWGNFYNKQGYLKEVSDKNKDLYKLAVEASGWFHIGDKLIIIKRPAKMHLDREGRFHCENGPAIKFMDNFEYWFWHGDEIRKEIINKPENFLETENWKSLNVEEKVILAESKNSPEMLLKKLATDKDETVIGKKLSAIAVANTNLRLETIEELFQKGRLNKQAEREYRKRLGNQIQL